ncbi:Uncharacterized protein BP5553_08788 [Venustampulla echinocandica]|uniref:Gylcosyl hydrolase 115 C-terminal domain-containing protein n=1 Tax=Venustampulla echinocandica TaxID=2656787 RepID=A0A370TF91_9HELO|nr:Uncharacterized protein BP5553_08788 [Venustampulla echinocandica]RDL33349.1 Uncharacterized protein BP5553_08788 [Venustampulla echinocandica]
MRSLYSFVVAVSSILPAVVALGQNATVTTTKSDRGLLQLAGSGVDGQILISDQDWWGVIRAAEDVALDIGKVTGKNLTLGNWSAGGKHQGEKRERRGPSLHGTGHNETEIKDGKTTVYYSYNPVTSFVNYTTGPAERFEGPTLVNNSPQKTVIIVGTIHKSPLIRQLAQAGKIDTTPILHKWESFISQVVVNPLPGVDRALVIAGSDMRGTIFGLYDISEQIGVSPWWWWADVVVRKREGVWALPGTKVQGPPTVKYRGIFLNDEQPGLTNWINSNYPPGKYGAGYNHYFYPHVFELLLRLRANYIWPTMWGSMFGVDDTANQAIADAYGIVMGTSHTEPMMRATNEWNTFGKQYGGNGQWEFDTNNASLTEFFTVGAERAKPYGASSLFTMAMRGNGDNALLLTEEEAMKVLQDVVATQRDVLGKVFNGTEVEDIPQVWCLYKEVQGYYERGLSVPDDVTLLWADDNWGNVRRLPIGNETSRSGGAGVYYHFDYVGDPRDYKWINTIQLEKTLEQMKLAHARQADRIWIVNVGDLKPLEIPINHFLDLAYDTPKWGYDSVPTWIKLWATREFGGEHAETITSVLDRYGMYAARRKYELLDTVTYSVVNYDEGDAILAQWDELAYDAQHVYNKLDDGAKPSFYEMILQPVLGGQVVNQIYVGAAKNRLYALQRRNKANAVIEDVLDYFKMDHLLTKRYHDLLDGKWNHMLDQTHLGYDLSWKGALFEGYWQQPMRNSLPALSYVQELETSLAGNIGVAVEASNATVSGDDAWHPNSGVTLVLPPMSPYGPKTRWIEIYARGTSGCSWNITPWSDYVVVSPSSGYTGGNNGSDTRVHVSINWSKAPPPTNTTTVNINITSSCADWGNYPAPMVQVPVQNVAAAKDFTGFVESDKHISIEAEHTSRNSAINGVSYTTLPAYGRTLSGVTLIPVLAPSQPAGTGPVLEYDIFTFTNTSAANVTLFLSPSLNQNGDARPLKYGIAFDDETPQVRQFVANATGGNLPKGWNQAVADGIWGLSSGNSTTTKHDLTKTGKHTLKIWAVEPGVVLQKVIVDLGGVRQSYLGPPESFRAGTDKTGEYGGTNFAGLDVKDVLW